MTSLYIPHLLILTGLIGIHSDIITVSKVSVQTRGSISIPCLYGFHHRNHVKYLCRGFFFNFCKIVVQTNQPKSSSGRFSIYDDTNQTIFTVSINDLRDEDNYYSWWCAVEIENAADVKQRLYLSVTSGMSNLYVDQQELTAFEGGSVTVLCHYKYLKQTRWCRLSRDCVTDQTGSIDGTPVTINTSVPDVFSVAMSKLRKESSGWYLCSNGDLEMPVHITVNELISTTTTTVSPTTAMTLSTTQQHSSMLTSTEPCTAHPTNTTIATTGGESLQDDLKSSTKVTILITTLVLLLLVVPAAFFGWRMIKHSKSKPEGPDIAAGSQTGRDPEVLYATVTFNKHVAAQRKGNHMPEESVTYSTIVIKDRE
ncbi:uncharacterized protein LOC108897245 [Lates calcarifer]|uniref:Uncharacterized protein LOC108897245 n=2 Tax=Lates calcarifer TaxID=8187 RepID=A0AAJ7QC98_LATCA|nr:uncharacterized protein LOC108897245 [Lates calcarifer]